MKKSWTGRYQKVTDKKHPKKEMQRASYVPPGYEECTFTPNINRLKDTMGSAQAYVKTDVFSMILENRNVPR